MDTKDILGFVHPAIAVAYVFPMVGIVVHMAWQTRQRRLQVADGKKSKIPPVVGPEHVKIGRWLTGSVVGVTLVALAYVLFVKQRNLFSAAAWQDAGGLLVLQLLYFAVTIAALVFLYRATAKSWRVAFTTLASAGLVVLGAQEGVFRRTNEWYMSHYYFGVVVSILMVASLAMLPEIYRDRSNRWRNAHIILNCLAVLLFVGQGITGVRDLWEIGFYSAPSQSRAVPEAPTAARDRPEAGPEARPIARGSGSPAIAAPEVAAAR